MCIEILSRIAELKPDFIVCLGDILDRHEMIHVKPLEAATQFLYEMTLLAPLFVLIGNHDRPNNSNFLTTEHPFNALKQWENIHIIDTTASAVIDNHRFIFVPYVAPGRFLEALTYIKDPLKDTTCIFAHQEFKNAKMGAIVSTEGDPWDLSYPLVISGHVHDFDQLQPNLLYTGTPIQHAFGDKDNKCCIMGTFDSEFTFEKINLDMPLKRIVHLSCKDFIDYTVPSKNQKDHIKLVIAGTTSEIQTTMKFPKVKDFQKKYKLVFKDIPMIIDTDTRDIKRKSFRERIEEKIGDNKRLRQTYNEVFGQQ
jgi:DNA repair exonuclease SbcCD nuclease subunit